MANAKRTTSAAAAIRGTGASSSPHSVSKSALHYPALAVISISALATRTWGISHPQSYTGPEFSNANNACNYLSNSYFFDTHPPFAKLLLAATAYLTNPSACPPIRATDAVPLSLRFVPAILGALSPLLLFLTLREMRVPTLAAILGASLVVFENALIQQSRLINEDPVLFFCSVLAVYSWVQFRRRRYSSFTVGWWFWLHLTGIALGLAAGTRVTGLATVLFILLAAAVDLFELLNPDRTASLLTYTRHVIARASVLVAIPIAIYLSIFYIHLSYLTHTGTGDANHSIVFQSELIGNEYQLTAPAVAYDSVITLQNRDFEARLFSTSEKYPVNYINNRVGSGGNQVSGDTAPIPNSNHSWKIEQSGKAYGGKGELLDIEKKPGFIKDGDVVRLRHVETDSYLVTHDVASPLTEDHMEMTTLPPNEAEDRFWETLWKVVVIEEGGVKMGRRIRAKKSFFKLVNTQHKVSLHFLNGLLPEWGSGRYEVNGDKDLGERYGVWKVAEVVSAPDLKEEPETDVDRPPKLTFLQKYVELQTKMIRLHNSSASLSNSLTIPGFLVPDLANPDDPDGELFGAPFVIVANPVVWALTAVPVAILLGSLGADAVLERRLKSSLLRPDVRRTL
ncbi:hypothetical protein HK097_002187, partial [Rhizophlyctis rosea]